MRRHITVSISPPADPRTPEEWQTVLDIATSLLAIYNADERLEINVGRCALLVQLATEQGIRPQEDAVAHYVAKINAQIEEGN